MTNFQSDFGGVKRFLTCFFAIGYWPGGVAFLRRVVQSKVEFKGLLLSYSEHATDVGNYLNEHDQVWRISEKTRFESKKCWLFRKFQKKQDFENYFDFSKNFENFRTPQNRSIVVRFQFSALWDQISDRGTKNKALPPPLGQCFDNYVHTVVSHVPMLVCVISVRSHWQLIAGVSSSAHRGVMKIKE